VVSSEELPGELADLVSRVRRLAESDAAAMTPDERAGWLVGLQRLTDATDAASLHVLSTFDAAGDAEVLRASRSSASWLREELGIAAGDAATRVRLARHSRGDLQSAHCQLQAGTVTYDHLRVISSSVADLPEEHSAAAAGFLTDLATRTDVGRLRRAAQHLSRVMLPDGGLSNDERDYSRRRLTLSPLLDGMYVLDGLLDVESAATLNAALQPFLVPAGPEDRRNTPQRRADGLVALAASASAQTPLPAAGASRTEVQVICHASALTAAGSGSAEITPTPGGAGVIGTTAVQRLSCDAHLARVLLNSEAVPVELGRSRRLFTSHQRRLLALRDSGCRFPGCGLPAEFTDAHHLTPWQLGGATDLTNGVLVCRHHHRSLHEGQWQTRLVDPDAGANGPIDFTAPHGLTTLRSDPERVTRLAPAIPVPPPDTS
jgi:hypothetical protein